MGKLNDLLAQIISAINQQKSDLEGKAPSNHSHTEYAKSVNGVLPDAAGNVQVTVSPEQLPIVDSIDEMTDQSKAYVLSTDGMIYKYGEKTVVQSAESVFDKSTAQINARIDSAGQDASTTNGSKGSFRTDYIELTDWESLSSYIVRTNFEIQSVDIDANGVYFYDADKAYLNGPGIIKTTGSIITVGNGVSSIDLKQWGEYPTAKYVRFRFYKKPSTTALVDSDLDDVEITFDAHNKMVTETGFFSTGMSFVSSDYSEEIANLRAEVDALASLVSSGSSEVVIPEAWSDAVTACVNKIKALQIGRNCVTFPFFSDNHQNIGYSGVLIAKVMQECHIPYCFYGGDSISSGTIETEAEMIAQDKAFDDMMAPVPNGRLCRAVGNHDGYWKTSAGETYTYTRAQVYELFMREESVDQRKHYGADGTYYYVDDIASKVRFVILNFNDYDDIQLAWIDEALTFTESGWGVVFIAHAPITDHYGSYNAKNASVREKLKAYISGTAENKADVIGWFGGHIHRDRIFEGVASNPGYDGSTDSAVDSATGDPIAETLPWKTVSIISDATNIGYGGVKYTGTDATQKHAIDFVTINKDTKTVNLTRLGFGSDRSFTY